MSPFRIFGGLAIAFGLLLFVLIAANLEARSSGGHDLLPLSSVALPSVVIGIGLLLHHKWAAVLFAGSLGVAGLWLAIGSSMEVPMPYMLINVLFGCALLVPSAVVIRCWSQLNRN